MDSLLTNYELRGLLNYLNRDNTLDVEIRENYINIYYRGGSALKITQVTDKIYDYHFDNNYFKSRSLISDMNIPLLNSETNWRDYFPNIKQAMDFWFTENPKEEREFQQLVVRENNYSSIASSTDYFILDIEYDNRKNARFDIVAMEWKSDASSRKLQKGYKPKLTIIEMKYGDGAVKGSAGIKKHINDFNHFMTFADEVNEFKKEMLSVLHQKRLLNLIPCVTLLNNPNEITEFQDDIDLMFLMANHDPASSILRDEIQDLPDDILFAVSNFAGYGLYKENIFSIAQFKERFKIQI